MLTLKSSNYEFDDYLYLARALDKAQAEIVKGCASDCDNCPRRYACDDIESLIKHVNKKLVDSTRNVHILTDVCSYFCNIYMVS